jgi:uncharacterized protein (TIGR03083 family)
MSAELDFLDHLELESARFAEAIDSARPEAAVQWFWGTVVRERMTDVPGNDLTPSRPADRAELAAFFDRVSRELADVLAATPPSTPAWTWSKDQTAGFIRRRQAHEALIHRVDAELTAGRRTPMDPGLSADGVDEALRIMYGGVPPWGTFTRSDPGDPADAEVVGTAADLDCWLWHRPEYTPIATSGDPEVLARFQSAIAPGIN